MTTADTPQLHDLFAGLVTSFSLIALHDTLSEKRARAGEPADAEGDALARVQRQSIDARIELLVALTPLQVAAHWLAHHCHFVRCKDEWMVEGTRYLESALVARQWMMPADCAWKSYAGRGGTLEALRLGVDAVSLEGGDLTDDAIVQSTMAIGELSLLSIRNANGGPEYKAKSDQHMAQLGSEPRHRVTRAILNAATDSDKNGPTIRASDLHAMLSVLARYDVALSQQDYEDLFAGQQSVLSKSSSAPRPPLPVQKNVRWEEVLLALGDRAAFFEMQMMVAEGSDLSEKLSEEMEDIDRRSMSVIAGSGPAMVTHQAIALIRTTALTGARRHSVQACLASLKSLIEGGIALPLAAYRQERLSTTLPELEMPRRLFPPLWKQAKIRALLDDWQAIAEQHQVQTLIAEALDTSASAWREETAPVLSKHIKVTQERLEALRAYRLVSEAIAYRLAEASRLGLDMRVDALSSMQSSWQQKYI